MIHMKILLVEKIPRRSGIRQSKSRVWSFTDSVPCDKFLRVERRQHWIYKNIHTIHPFRA